MIETTLTIENLKNIYDAMNKIKEIDRSNYFSQYFNEVKERIKNIELDNDILLLEKMNEILKIYKDKK